MSLRFAYNLDTSGDLCIGERQPDGRCTIDKIEVGGLKLRVDPNPSRATLRVPKHHIFRAGVRYIHRDAAERELFDVELDFVWEGTSRTEQLGLVPDAPLRVLFEDGDPAPGDPVRSVAHPYAWDDGWSLRLGGSYTFYHVFRDADLRLHAGGLYETPVAPTSHMRLAFASLARIGFSLGVGLRWGRYRLDIGYARLFHRPRDVDPPGTRPAAYL